MVEDLYEANIARGLYDSIETVYEKYKDEFIHWMKKTYGCSAEDAVEIYQVSVVIVYENIISGKLNELNSGIKTYLFAIGKHQYLEKSRRRSAFIYDWDFSLESDEADTSELLAQKEQNIELVIACLDEIGEKCKSILSLFYYRNMSMEEIAAKEAYKNADTVKNLKFKCMNRLKKIFKEKAGFAQ